MTGARGSVDGAAAASDAGSGRAVWGALGRLPRGVTAVMRYFVAPRWWVEILVLGALYGIYSMIRNMADGDVGVAFKNGRDILAWEDEFGLAFERWLNEFVNDTPPVAALSALEYASLHFIVTPGVLIWLFVAHRNRYRLMSSVLVFTTGFALIGFYTMPTAPPRMLADERFVDIMAKTGSWGWWPESGAPGSDAVSNQFAAMPSLHCAWATWCGIMLVHFGRRHWVRVLGCLYPFTTFFVVMGTGNHYFIDVVAGLGTLLVGALAAYGMRYLWRRYLASPLSGITWRDVTAGDTADIRPGRVSLHKPERSARNLSGRDPSGRDPSEHDPSGGDRSAGDLSGSVPAERVTPEP
ncbi:MULTISPECIES: phosphatase PAP2 family protein [Gordonia]|nr:MULTISPECIES: phosphatase PAP2 family protein [Gordonia]